MKIIILFVITLLLTSCWHNENKKDGFYDYSRFSYFYRLPIIDPYTITSADNGASWVIGLRSDSPLSRGGQFLTKVGVYDSIFVVYSPRDLSFSSDHPQVWIIVDVPNKDEKVFTSETKYKSYLKQKGAENIQLRNINDVFAEFDKNKRLPSEWPK